MVTRLSGTDAVSLHTQTSKTPAHTVALIIVEASDRSVTSGYTNCGLVAATTGALPQPAGGKPLGIGQPVWAEIDDYDPSAQIHCVRLALPAVDASSPISRRLEYRQQESRRPAVGSVDYRWSGRGPVGVGGEDVACFE